MYKLCQTEASQNRQREVEDCLLALLQTQPWGEITVSALCTAAGIPRRAFYRYFDTKEDVLYTLIDQLQQEYLAAGPAGRGDRAAFGQAESERMFRYWYDHRELLDALVKNGMEDIWLARMTAIAIRERVGNRYAQQRDGLRYRLMTTFIINGLLSCVLFDHSTGWQYTPAQMAHITAELLTKPLYDTPRDP